MRITIHLSDDGRLQKGSRCVASQVDPVGKYVPGGPRLRSYSVEREIRANVDVDCTGRGEGGRDYSRVTAIWGRLGLKMLEGQDQAAGILVHFGQ